MYYVVYHAIAAWEPSFILSYMQTNFSELCEAQFQNIVLVPEIILGIQFVKSFFVQEKSVIQSLKFRNAINLQS